MYTQKHKQVGNIPLPWETCLPSSRTILICGLLLKWDWLLLFFYLFMSVLSSFSYQGKVLDISKGVSRNDVLFDMFFLSDPEVQPYRSPRRFTQYTLLPKEKKTRTSEQVGRIPEEGRSRLVEQVPTLVNPSSWRIGGVVRLVPTSTTQEEDRHNQWSNINEAADQRYHHESLPNTERTRTTTTTLPSHEEGSTLATEEYPWPSIQVQRWTLRREVTSKK